MANLYEGLFMNITRCELHTEYLIDSILASEEDMKDFLFTLGCYPGERIILISRLASIYIINIKNSRYSIDKDLAEAICLRNPIQRPSTGLMGRVV